jgi:hypothetical protein
MKFDNTPKPLGGKLSLAKFSGWSSGISWFLLFSVIFSDQIFGMGEDGSEAAIYLCIGPLFILAVLGFILGIITSVIARSRRTDLDEEDRDFAINGLKYALIGIGFIILAPFINRLIEPLIGIELYDVTSLFGF